MLWITSASPSRIQPASCPDSKPSCQQPAPVQVQPVLQAPVVVSHDCPAGQNPQAPPQPSSPHFFPAQLGTHETQEPESEHTSGFSHVPQKVPQPSGPHCFPLQFGVHTVWHFPLASQNESAGQLPQ
jgi:hypothetical protein